MKTPPGPSCFAMLSLSWSNVKAAWTKRIGVVTYPTSGPTIFTLTSLSGGLLLDAESAARYSHHVGHERSSPLSASQSFPPSSSRGAEMHT